MKRDLASNVKVSRALSPAVAVTNDDPFVSQICDTKGFGSVMFVGLAGSLADANATFTILVEDGDASNLSDNAAVDDQYLNGVEAISLRYDSDNKAFKIGYCGPKRYVRVTITPSGNTGDVYLAGLWIQGHPIKAPQSTQLV